MVSTRSSMAGSSTATGTGTKVSPDENRIVAVVTGANSGMGYGTCQALLRCLSLPPGEKIYETEPVLEATHPSLHHLFDGPPPPPTVPSDPPPVLTLVMVSRSSEKLEAARTALLEEHEALLLKRAKKGMPVREGWWEGLEIRIEIADLSEVGGDKGVLALCQRLHDTLPHITSLFLNAGLASVVGTDFWKLIVDTWNLGIESFVLGLFQLEARGWKTKDGERGLVWSVNVLSGYIMAKELIDLLRRSPKALGIAPRIIYTTSRTADPQWQVEPLTNKDPQLLDSPYAYRESKYLGSLITCELDKEYGRPTPGKDGQSVQVVRCINADPGAAFTNYYDEGFKTQGRGFALYLFIFRWGYWALFVCLRAILGSIHHAGPLVYAAHAMVYSALVPSEYIADPEVSPGTTIQISAKRFSRPTVLMRETIKWQEYEWNGEEQVELCERIRQEWKKREGRL